MYEKLTNREATAHLKALGIPEEKLIQFQRIMDSTFSLAGTSSPINLLPFLRKIKVDDIDLELRGISIPEALTFLFCNNLPSVSLIPTCSSQGETGRGRIKIFTPDYEADQAHALIRFRTEDTQGFLRTEESNLILFWCLTLMITDCTGCCNAITQFNASDIGIYMKSQIGNTYHS